MTRKRRRLVIKFFAPFVLVSTLTMITACANSESGGSTTAQCPQADTVDISAITQERADMLIGFTESDAESCAANLGWVFRVGERDGEGFALTADYSQQRVTVSVTDDLVTAVAVG